jgi:hypothetical protein
MPPLRFDALRAITCVFTNNLCLQGRRETVSFQLFPPGPEVQPGVTIPVRLHSEPAEHTVTVWLVDAASTTLTDKPTD